MQAIAVCDIRIGLPVWRFYRSLIFDLAGIAIVEIRVYGLKKRDFPAYRLKRESIAETRDIVLMFRGIDDLRGIVDTLFRDRSFLPVLADENRLLPDSLDFRVNRERENMDNRILKTADGR